MCPERSSWKEVGRKRDYSMLAGGKERKSKMVASCAFLEDELRQCSKGRRSDDGRQCGNARSGLESKSQEVGSKGKTR